MEIPELDDTTAILAYTQDLKQNIGITDSFTQNKTKEQAEQESRAKDLVNQRDQELQQKQEQQEALL